jgi:hypothetical protein
VRGRSSGAFGFFLAPRRPTTTARDEMAGECPATHFKPASAESAAGAPSAILPGQKLRAAPVGTMSQVV